MRTSPLAHILHLGKNLGNGRNAEEMSDYYDARDFGQRQIISAVTFSARAYNSRQLGERNLASPERLAGSADWQIVRENNLLPHLVLHKEVKPTLTLQDFCDETALPTVRCSECFWCFTVRWLTFDLCELWKLRSRIGCWVLAASLWKISALSVLWGHTAQVRTGAAKCQQMLQLLGKAEQRTAQGSAFRRVGPCRHNGLRAGSVRRRQKVQSARFRRAPFGAPVPAGTSDRELSRYRLARPPAGMGGLQFTGVRRAGKRQKVRRSQPRHWRD